MSTRATYTIKDGANDRHFYIHHDGYSEGAAEYFYNALAHNTGRGGLAEKFLRANINAEFTSKPESHGDTEFHYVLEANGNFMQYRRTNDQDMRLAFIGKVWEFVNRYKEFGIGESPITYKGERVIKPIHQFLEDAQLGASYVKNHPEFIGNCASTISGSIKLCNLVIAAADEFSEQHPGKNGNAGELIGIARARLEVLNILEGLYKQAFTVGQAQREQLINTIKENAGQL